MVAWVLLTSWESGHLITTMRHSTSSRKQTPLRRPTTPPWTRQVYSRPIHFSPAIRMRLPPQRGLVKGRPRPRHRRLTQSSCSNLFLSNSETAQSSHYQKGKIPTSNREHVVQHKIKDSTKTAKLLVKLSTTSSKISFHQTSKRSKERGLSSLTSP